MQQRQKQQKNVVKQQGKRIFTASEVAEFEYCPLAWWYEQYEPAAKADTEELFARMVELEHEHETQAPALPEYQMIEQVLLRRGAFQEGQEQHLEHAEEVAEIEEERVTVHNTIAITRRVVLIVIAIVIFSLALVLLSQVLH
jgi:hypothetical protein